ncbi:MAG: hypothetical protein Q7S68_03040, partial [Deltaproteobacteria bacterium]|nr:hypothetical protein [Deltaproteobacteria bacterium]
EAEGRRGNLQPDAIFPEILSAMGVSVSFVGENLRVEPSKKLKPIQVDLTNTPDLYPVLSVLTALADGKSVLRGAPHLVYKESNRVKKTAELLSKMKQALPLTPTLSPEGRGNQIPFDPEGDHRLVMAATVAKRAGFPIHILHPEVVNKSFPSFLLL